ncbi:hypothetical protein ABFG93_19250 [Pseudalkalibacillus hwajinpoensis]|uniref:hypothetical protein n=1 Tax=Guptibacillus hwajinpoensis TaxID=208199 RepID=UPI00325BB46A
METVYGVEMKPPIGKLPGFIAQIIKKTAELATVMDRDKRLVIISNKEEALTLQDYYLSKGVFEEFYSLLPLSPNANPYASFYDYGFVSQNTNYFLYENLVSYFIISTGVEEQIEMAQLQMDEHVIAKDDDVFYIDHMHTELMEGIARAYQLELTFLPE